jgi:hypothetical protein
MTTDNKRKTINRADFFKLCNWLTSNKDEIENQKTYTAVGKLAQDALDLEVGTSGIKQAMETTGLRLASPPQPVSEAVAISTVAAELVRLMEALGHQPTEALKQVAAATTLI